MAKIKIITKTCPLCRYTYERIQKYEMVKKEINPMFNFGNINRSKKAKIIKSVEECTENTITKGDQDFEYIYHEDNNPMEECFGGSSVELHRKCIGMFCPKCEIFLNDKICSKYEEEEI